MKKFMAMAAFAAMAVVIAFPALAQDGESTTGEPLPKASADDFLPKAPPADLPKEDPAPEPTIQEEPPAAPPGDPAPGDEVGGEPPIVDTGAGNDTGGGDGNNGPGPGEEAPSTDAPITNTADRSEDDVIEATGKDSGNKETRDEVVNTDDEDRKDQKATKVEADDDEDDDRDSKRDKDDDRDGKKDEDDDDEGGVEQGNDQDVESGDADQDADVINTGDNVNQCVAILQVANTGNAVSNNGVIQNDNEDAEVELEDGSTINITPKLVLKCKQVIRQVVRSERLSDSDARKLSRLLQPRSNAPVIRTGGVPSRITGAPGRVGAGSGIPTSRLSGAAAPKVLSASRGGQPKSSSLSRLPRTGGFSGYATVLGLGTGVLLVGGGLLVRRLSR